MSKSKCKLNEGHIEVMDNFVAYVEERYGSEYIASHPELLGHLIQAGTELWMRTWDDQQQHLKPGFKIAEALFEIAEAISKHRLGRAA
jgi:hypothetical protein